MGFIGNLFGEKEAKQAADEQEKGYKDAESTHREAGAHALARYGPYANTSMKANGMLDAALDGDYSSFYQSPDYQFRLKEGEKAINRSAAARGGLLSGAALKDLNNYTQDVASTEYGNWYGRLAGLRSEGIGIANSQAEIDMGVGDRVAQAQTGAAGARASGYMAKGNIKNYLASSIHESGQKIGEAWATMGMA
ncbi:hypothetical protein [uncultured Microbulbifer sp.]|uniref:hypothetical protein n=1 Tax=uncultured Microbulbifer sp. TaxID=348147 RepID=UPI00262EA204|nr:hypothetical protein [uncultured Microbulbifer sp.]